MKLSSLLRPSKKAIGSAKGKRGRHALDRAVNRSFETLEGRQLLTAVVTTDKDDYAPGSTAAITASNDSIAGLDFAVGEQVEFQVRRTDGVQDYPNGNLPWRVTDGATAAPYQAADGVWVYPDLDGSANAQIQTTWYVEQQYAGAS